MISSDLDTSGIIQVLATAKLAAKPKAVSKKKNMTTDTLESRV